MEIARKARAAMPVLACAMLAACGTGAGAADPTPIASPASIPTARATSARLLDWPEFGLNPQRSDVSELSTGITSANAGALRRLTVTLPGTVDSSPIYIHAASVAGGTHNVVVVTTTYGRTIALDADSARTLWQFNPPGLSRWLGSAQITTASPVLDGDLVITRGITANWGTQGPGADRPHLAALRQPGAAAPGRGVSTPGLALASRLSLGARAAASVSTLSG